MSAKLDQMQVIDRVRFLNERCERLRTMVLDRCGELIERPQLALEGGSEVANMQTLEAYETALLEKLAGGQKPASSATTAPASSAATPSAAAPATGPLTKVEITSLQVTERVFYAKGRLTAEQCRERIAMRRQAAEARRLREQPATPSGLTWTQKALKAKGLPLDTEVRISTNAPPSSGATVPAMGTTARALAAKGLPADTKIAITSSGDSGPETCE